MAPLRRRRETFHAPPRPPVLFSATRYQRPWSAPLRRRHFLIVGPPLAAAPPSPSGAGSANIEECSSKLKIQRSTFGVQRSLLPLSPPHAMRTVLSCLCLVLLGGTIHAASDETVALFMKSLQLETALRQRVEALDSEDFFIQDSQLKKKLGLLRTAISQAEGTKRDDLLLQLSRALAERAGYRAARAKLLKDHFSLAAVRNRFIDWLKTWPDAAIEESIALMNDPGCMTGRATLLSLLLDHPIREIKDSLQIHLPEIRELERPPAG